MVQPTDSSAQLLGARQINATSFGGYGEGGDVCGWIIIVGLFFC